MSSPADSEEVPLLPPAIDVYRRFSRAEKRSILMMVSGCGLIPLFVTGTFTPSIPQIAQEMNSTGEVVSIAMSITVFAASIGGLIGASYSTYYGRRPVYLFSLPVLVVGSIGVATARSVEWLLFWRFWQAIGPSPGMVVGAGVLGDIYKLEERGSAMGVFFAAGLLGPAIAPVMGGFSAHHYSWRVVQGALGILGLVIFTIIYFFLPETSQPGARGIDKVQMLQSAGGKPRGFVIINPLRPMRLLRSPNLFLICMITSASLMTVFALLVPLSYTIGIRYNLPNEAWVGACFLPAGLGNIAGAIIVGRVSDRTVIKWRMKRQGRWYPEDRLRAALLPFGVLVPLPLISFAIINRFVEGRLGIFLSLLCLFVNGIGVEMAFGPCAAYLVDVMHSQSAESLAANSGLRSVIMSFAIASALPMINQYGILVTYAVIACVVLVAFGMLASVIQYGDRMRAWVDVGFSKIEDN